MDICQFEFDGLKSSSAIWFDNSLIIQRRMKFPENMLNIVIYNFFVPSSTVEVVWISCIHQKIPFHKKSHIHVRAEDIYIYILADFGVLRAPLSATSPNRWSRTNPKFEQTQKFLALGGLRIIRPPPPLTLSILDTAAAKSFYNLSML